MSMAARQGGKPRKTQDGNMGNNQGGNRNRGPWRNSGAPTNYSPSMNNNQRLPPQQQQQQQQQQNGGANQGGHSHNFPPLSQNIQDKLAAMVPQIGATIIITSRTGQRHEGTVTTINPEGDPAAGFILKDVKDLGNPSGPLKETYFCPTTSIQSWIPAPSKPTDTFRTDTDISASAPKRERELQAWQPDAPAPPAAGVNVKGDDATFGVNASGEGWDQFAANEALFGITAGFDEDQYTTKLDTSAPDFKEREKKAQQLANEILRSTTNNAHIAEERVMNNTGGNDTNEEDKYGAVVRNPNAYVPPGARKNGAPSNLTGKASPGPAATKPSPGAAAPIPKITTNGPDDKAAAAAAAPGPGTVRFVIEPQPLGSTLTGGPQADNLVGTFRDFVTNEKQRLTQKKEAIVKHEMNKRMQDLVRFSKSFKLSQPIPEDLVPILTKDVSKQKAILEKSSKDAESTAARAIASQPGASSSRPSPQVSSPPANKIAKPAVGTTSPAPVAGSSKIKQGLPARSPINMVIQKIPPFDPAKRKAALAAAAAASANGTAPAGAAGTPAASATNTAANGAKPAPPAASAAAQPPVPPSPAGSAKLNIGAPTFKPASTFKPATSPAASSPKSKTSDTAASPAPAAATPPNPFFGTRPIKKGPVHVKDDFNPFKFAKVAEASAVNATWPYSGKRFMQLFPVIQPMQHVPHPPMPVQPPQVAPPPAAYEDDPNQAAARGYGMVYYAPYPYPGQPPQMMAVPPGGAPPGTYIPSPYMQPMGYPHPMPPGAPPAMYHPPPPTMPGMPPPQAYPMPPGAYPPPNGQPPRGSMPPTPMPPHAYAYHPSPQLGHAVPYQVMMPPPGAPPPHGYEAVPQQGPPGTGPGGPPVPMGTH